jgi:KTSC domain
VRCQNGERVHHAANALELNFLGLGSIPSSAPLADIEFRTRKLYRYFNVPARYYRELLAAGSKGRYCNSNIRNRFFYQDLSRSPAPLVLAAGKTK